MVYPLIFVCKIKNQCFTATFFDTVDQISILKGKKETYTT